MKRTLQVFLITAIMYSTAAGTVLPGNISTRVYLRDSNTPVELVDQNVPWIYRDIMAGTQLKIIVDSNVNGDWSGGLFIPRAELDLGHGELYCRGIYCEGSILTSAGEGSVDRWDDEIIGGYYTLAGMEAATGDWFVIDYNAISVGNCHVGLYDDNWSIDEPFYEMSFTQVPSRDFNSDHIVNFKDFAVFGSYWGTTGCTDPENCGKVDFHSDEAININDLAMFVEYWLEGTS